MKNYIKFIFKYMNFGYFLFCEFVVFGLGCYLNIPGLYQSLCICMIASALLPSKIEYDEAIKEGLIKSRK